MAFENLITESLVELSLPDETYVVRLSYSARFKGYNGTISLRGHQLTLRLSKKWKGVSADIQKGIIQELLCKLFKIKKKTTSIDLYHSFLKNVHHSIIKTHTEPALEESFNRVNERFFLGLMDAPNFVLGNGTRKLGSYEYGTDTIMISNILLDDEQALDYVMYHEMLHKHHKFSEGRHHTKEFRADEKKFGNTEELEQRLQTIVRAAKRKKRWKFW